MTHQTETTRELSLEDLDRVSGAGLGIPQFYERKPPGGEASLPKHPDAIGPEYAAIRGVVGPEI